MTDPKSKTKSKFLIAVVVLIAAGASGFYFYQNHQQTAASKNSFRKIPVKKDRLEVTILTTGVVQPENRVEIKPPIAGRVETVLIKEGDHVRKGQTLAWMSSTERAALLDAANARGPDELKQWEEMYRSTPILAPIRGTIIQRNVESGQVFTAADAVFVMSDRLTVKAQVDETDIAQVKLKQKAKITLDAYPNQVFTAQVDQIAYDAKTVNNVTTYVVDVLPDTPPEFIRSGMTANVTFEVNSKEDVLLIPVEAVRIQDSQSTVLVPSADPNGPPVSREITTGLTDGKRIEVASGLAEGDFVLTPEFKMDGKKSPGGGSPFSPMGSRPRGK